MMGTVSWSQKLMTLMFTEINLNLIAFMSSFDPTDKKSPFLYQFSISKLQKEANKVVFGLGNKIIDILLICRYKKQNFDCAIKILQCAMMITRQKQI